MRLPFPSFLILATLVSLHASAASLAGGAPQRPGTAAIPRAPDGKPDLSGIWQVMNTAAWDIQDHSAQKGVPAGHGVVEGGDIPYQPWALAKRKENYEQRATLDPESKCYLPGVPRIMYMPFPFQIIQKPNELTILFEYVHAVRYIFTSGTPHPSGDIDWWLGDSRGRWEGNSLVVDVIHFNDQTWFDRAGNFHSDALHLTERYTLIDPDHISYAVTVDDPKVFTRPWNMNMILYRHKEKNFQLLEYECYGFDFEKLYPFPGIGAPK
jgi:hypothetical protein